MGQKIICSTTDNIEVLGLSVRFRNALMRSKIFDVGELIVLNDDQLFAIRNLGEKGVAEIKDRLSKIQLLDAPQSALENKLLKEWLGEPQILIDLGPPMVPRHEVIEWQQMMLARQIEASLLHPQLEIDGYALAELVDVHSHTAGLYEILLKILTAPISVAHELEHMLYTVPPREIDILIRRFGFERQTLETIASHLGISRERVRQIEKQAIARVQNAASGQQLMRIQSAILFADDTDLSFDDWSKRLIKTGLVGEWSQKKFAAIDQLELLILVCTNSSWPVLIEIPRSLTCMIKLHRAGKSSAPARTLTLLDNFTKVTERLVKRHLRYSGAVSLNWLVNQDSVDFNIRDLGLVLETKGYLALDENWYMSREYDADKLEKNSVFHRSLLKSFQFCGPLEIYDVYYGLEHTLIKTDFPRPPITILSEALLRYGYDCEEGLWFWDGASNEELNRGERIIMRTLNGNGGVAHHSQLAMAFINSSSSFALLHSTLRRSPLFDNFEHSIYKLRGAVPNLASIQTARDSGIETPLNLEYYFDMEGNIVVRANLGTLAVGHGTITSSKLPNLVGIWDLAGFGSDSAEVEVTENEIRGLRQTIQLLGCEVGDRIKMTFDTDTHAISISRIE